MGKNEEKPWENDKSHKKSEMLAGKTVSDMGNCWEIRKFFGHVRFRERAGGTPLGCPRKPSSSRSSTKLLALGKRQGGIKCYQATHGLDVVIFVRWHMAFMWLFSWDDTYDINYNGDVIAKYRRYNGEVYKMEIVGCMSKTMRYRCVWKWMLW